MAAENTNSNGNSLSDLTNSSTTLPTGTQRFQFAKRKLERIKTKLYDFFQNQNSNTSLKYKTKTNNSTNDCQNNYNPAFVDHSLIINNCYYGYRSNIFNEKSNKMNNDQSSSEQFTSDNLINSACNQCMTPTINQKSVSLKNNNKSMNTSDSNSVDSSFVMSITTTDSEMSSIIDKYQYHKNSNTLNSINPFMSKSMTNLIDLKSDLNHIEQLGEPFVHTIDENDNLFNETFMTNFIYYILVKEIKRSDYFVKMDLLDNYDDDDDVKNSLSTQNLLKKVSGEIYKLSENEPCGIKGCSIAIYIDNCDDKANQLTIFKFDSSNSLTTFELALILKTICVKNQATLKTTFGLFKNGLFNNNNNNSQANNNTSNNQKRNCIDPINYELIKHKLY
jgi:hypothetical protein